ncbi:hypothetical protein FHW88_005055 [Mucilaginibacter sp. SG538B]|uniref:DUF7009 family protein n=1 Tax=Mucilaginibacter sp. SG538B TaxID=2587021 RepID=UPI00159D04DF|nr:hypothetical protein [Mucilaginibacter sp. SG538B]NVM66737.1 hypothetical protein [Mucilaginibacter sp. SG538B]
MKIRIRGNSIRYRLSRSEVSRLAEEKFLTEEVDFGSMQFNYSIRVTRAPLLTASFNGGTIEIAMPEAMIRELNDTDKVGFKANHEKLFLLVEKDFVCIDQTDEDQSDNYPHPDPLKC